VNTFLSSAQQILKEQYRAFAKEHVAPIAEDLAGAKIDLKQFLKKLGQLEYLGLTVPKEYGGQGGSFLNLCLFVEAVSEFEPGLGLTMAGHVTCVELIKKFGSARQKSNYLPLLAKGESLGTIAVSEVQAGTDYAAIISQAERKGEDIFLSGKKALVINGQLASLFVVLTRYSDNVALWLVDKESSTAFVIHPNRERLGLCSASANDLEFFDHKINSDCLLGGKDALSSDHEQVLFAMDISKVIVAASAVGLVEGALSQAAHHANTREQFGEPIGQFQAVQWKIADMSVETACAQLLLYRAAWSKDESAHDFRRFAAMCKVFASKVARVHSGEALQILGSTGLIADSPVERFYRDAKVMEIVEGTSEFQKMILTRELGI
jgi:alkylation response protein AidB-like acyl-CoA dehydrogenase